MLKKLLSEIPWPNKIFIADYHHFCWDTIIHELNTIFVIIILYANTFRSEPMKNAWDCMLCNDSAVNTGVAARGSRALFMGNEYIFPVQPYFLRKNISTIVKIYVNKYVLFPHITDSVHLTLEKTWKPLIYLVIRKCYMIVYRGYFGCLLLLKCSCTVSIEDV